MLVALSIRDIVLIDRLDIAFEPGLSVLTGETGAGKSILLDSLALALGARADAALIRSGEDRGSVSAEFRLPDGHTALTILDEQALPREETLTLRRVVQRDGRSRAFVNGEAVSAGTLRILGAMLVDIHGQHAEMGLLDPAGHRRLLDLFGGHADDLKAVAARHAAWREASDALQAAQARAERAAAEEDYLRHILEELEALAPGPHEEEELAAERERLQHAEKIADAYTSALAALSGDGRSVEERLSAASRAVARVSEWSGPAGQAAEAALERALIEVAEADAQIASAARDLDAEPEHLEGIEKRLFALRAAARKHRTTVDALPALLEQVREDVASIEGGALELGRLEKAVTEAETAYLEAAHALREKRRDAAGRLSAAVSQELAPLKLGSARFSVEMEELPPEQGAADGMDRVRFLIATNPGSAPGPLNKIASGGELSRFLLALNVVLADMGPVGTLIFDEVDRGVGGATAEAVGDRLARLARNYQVLVVTHSPQVAACGRYHWRIEKGDRDGTVLTRVDALDEAGRREEIARMLSGAEVTAEARAAADKLIEGLAT